MSTRESWPGEQEPEDEDRIDEVGEAKPDELDTPAGEPPLDDVPAAAAIRARNEAAAAKAEEREPEAREPAPEPEQEAAEDPARDGAAPELRLAGHAPGELEVPDDVDLLEGESRGARRGVGIVAARFNGDITSKLLEAALGELDRIGVDRDSVTVMAVPGAFELPLGAMALAKTRRYSSIVALGCVIRGETSHFEYVAGEAASGLQLAALETGVPVAFGVLTVDTLEQAMSRVDKGAEAVRTALEMADLFSQLRETAAGRK